MSSSLSTSFRQVAILLWALALGVTMTACSSGPLARKLHLEDTSPDAALAYSQGLSRLTPAELTRERTVLGALPQTPFNQVRMAMLLGHPRVQQDLARGHGMLEGVLKSTEPAAQTFHPLARQLADNYGERIKLEIQLERQGQQLKESQRKSAELQDKLDSLANIEKSLIPRPRPGKPEGARR